VLKSSSVLNLLSHSTELPHNVVESIALDTLGTCEVLGPTHPALAFHVIWHAAEVGALPSVLESHIKAQVAFSVTVTVTGRERVRSQEVGLAALVLRKYLSVHVQVFIRAWRLDSGAFVDFLTEHVRR
jgi:hypothetical protein